MTDLKHTVLNLVQRVTTVEQVAVLPSFTATGPQFSPNVSPPGQEIKLHGRNFDLAPVKVTFIPVSATFITPPPELVSEPGATQLVVHAPAAAAGSYRISVNTAGGTVTSDDTFTLQPFPAPAFAALNQITPNTASVGQLITLSGSNLSGPNLQVKFGEVEVPTTGFQKVDKNLVTVTVPAGLTPSQNPIKITITTAGGSTVSTETFTVTTGVQPQPGPRSPSTA
jgi:hypothetical protein